MADNPEFEGYSEPGPIIEQLRLGTELFEQLRQLDGFSELVRAVNEGMTKSDLQAFALARVTTFRQESLSSEDYGAWHDR